MITMICCGEDNLITDHPDTARSLLRERRGGSNLELLLVHLWSRPK
jgi:hypothetical protein